VVEKIKKRLLTITNRLHNNKIEDAYNGRLLCNAEYINEQSSHTIVITGCKPILSDDGELVIGLLVDPSKKPENYRMGNRCWINGREVPILTDKMILDGKI
jgi:hypothetical protein